VCAGGEYTLQRLRWGGGKLRTRSGTKTEFSEGKQLLAKVACSSCSNEPMGNSDCIALAPLGEVGLVREMMPPGVGPKSAKNWPIMKSPFAATASAAANSV
jgi:hypothetical protein